MAPYVALAAALSALGPGPDLTKLSDRDAVAAYRAAGLAIGPNGLSGRWAGTMAFDPIAYPFTPFDRVRAEVVRRGRAAVPDLLTVIREEVAADRPEPPMPTDSLTADLFELLVRAGDPRAVPVAVEIAAGPAAHLDRRWAVEAVERLTFCSARRMSPTIKFSWDSVPHPTAVPGDTPDLARAAKFFRDWLAGEGKNPDDWLPLARRRAAGLLAGDDPDAAYNAAEFLAARGGDPAVLVPRVAEFVAELRPGADRHMWTYRMWTYRGRPSTMSQGNWMHLLAAHGRSARPHAGLLVRYQKEAGENAWGYYALLRRFSGDEVTAHLFEALPRASAEVAKLKADPKTPKGFSNSDPRGWWFDSLREIRDGCDRWAGRRFDTDADRLAWWAANRGRPREAWLAENFDALMAQADAGDLWAQSVAYDTFPDLGRPDFRPPPEPPHFYTRWLARHRPDLQYDPRAEAFRLPTPRW
jgi:hypothetical protein